MHKLLNSSFISLYSQKVSSGFNYSNFQFTNQFLWQNLPLDSQDDSWLMQEYPDWWCSGWSSLHESPRFSTHTCLPSWKPQVPSQMAECTAESAAEIRTWPRCPEIFLYCTKYFSKSCSTNLISPATTWTLVQGHGLQNIPFAQTYSLAWSHFNYFDKCFWNFSIWQQIDSK